MTQPEFTIRPAALADADAIARVHVETWRAAYAGIVPEAFLRSLSFEQRAAAHRASLADPERRRQGIVAEAPGGGIVGFVQGGARRDPGPGPDCELYAIYVLPAYQGRGIGRSLTLAFARSMLDAGHRSMKLWVLHDNEGSIRFYEALGARRIGEEAPIAIGGLEFRKVALAFDDLESLAAPAGTGGPAAARG